MDIKWYGHASFAIKSSDDILVVTDPYDPDKTGFNAFPDKADIVIKSSSNDDFHDNDHLVPKKPNAVVIDALEVARNGGKTKAFGIEFRTVEAMESDDHPSGHPDQNGMYRFEMDGINVGHMGDMGNDFSNQQMEFFSGVDVLLAHAGGFPVISIEELERIIKAVRPKLVIPMHYCTPIYKPQDNLPIDNFLELFQSSDIDMIEASSTVLVRENLPETTRALVLQSA